ncbi:MAG: uracil-DNA glycosylase [Woeseia sp.]|nr:uracil-DNA glycosylase [Woeseia sp.]
MSFPANNHSRTDYLAALGIDVWQTRGTTDVAAEAVTDVVSPDTVRRGDASLLNWQELRVAVANCKACNLHSSRTQTVFGVGSETADLLIIGEAPGAEEDRRGEPFVGRAGQLLDEMLRAINLDRQTTFIANVLKCRPPGNRDPKSAEAECCRPFLDRQIALIDPKVILAVGRIAAQQLLGGDLPLGRMRGQKHVLEKYSAPIVVTYHPAYLLRSPSQKRKSWQDLCLARDLLQESAS